MAPSAANIDLDSVKAGIANIEKDTSEIKDALKAQSEEIKDVKEILQVGLADISNNMSELRGQVDQIQSTALKSFEMIKEMNYLDGIENIRSAHNVFFARSKVGLEKRIQQFESHSFELQKQFAHHMNPQKIGRFLKLLVEEDENGEFAALSMYHYVMTVEAMYLQMMCVYHINNEDLDELVDQLELFTTHCKELTSIMSSILKLDEPVESFSHEGEEYSQLSKFGQVMITNEAKVEELAIFVPKDSINTSLIFSRKGKDATLYHISLMWIACEAGDIGKIKFLMKLGADMNITAFDANGVPLSCLQIAAQEGREETIDFLLENGAKVNHGKNTLLEPSRTGSKGIVERLLKGGENPNRPGKNGETPFSVAKQEGHEKIANILEENGADTRSIQIVQKQLEEAKIQKEEEERARKEEERREEEEKRKKIEKEKNSKRTIKTKTMTNELKEILNKVKSIANVDDTWLNACNQAFAFGREVTLEYNPKGNSRNDPMMKIIIQNGNQQQWYTYPF